MIAWKIKLDWQIKTPSEFLATNNFYLINGEKYYRVTRILSIIDKPELRNWYAKLGRAEAAKTLAISANFGTMMHKLIEITLKNEEFHKEKYDAKMINSIELFNKWLDTKKDFVIESLEQHLWSSKYKYAGTCDCIAMIDGKRYILDWKSSKAIYNEYFLQLSAYMMAFKELTGLDIDGAYIIRIREGEKEEQFKSKEELEKLFEVFKSAIILFDWKYGGEK